MRKLRVNYPIAIGTKETKSLFTISETLPITVVINPKGEVRDVIEGIMYKDEFDQRVRPLLPDHPDLRHGNSMDLRPAPTIQRAPISR